MRAPRTLLFAATACASAAAALAFACGGAVPGVAPIDRPEDASVEAAVDAGATCALAHSTRTSPARPLRVLFVTKETLFFHAEAHQIGDVTVPAHLRSRGHEVTVTADSGVFTDAGLAPFDVVVLFVTSGKVIPEGEGRAAFARFVSAGKGVVGVHTASATDNDWPFMNELLGVVFKGHGMGDAQVTPARILLDDPSSPLTAGLPTPWERSDEWYYYDRNPALDPRRRRLLSLDESSLQQYRPAYPDEGFYGDAGHPLAWTQEIACGRTFYTSLGHTGSAWQEPAMLAHLAAGVEWAGALTAGGP